VPGSQVIDIDSCGALGCQYESKKDINVQTRAFDNTNPTASAPSLLSPNLEMSSYAAPLMVTHVVDSSVIDAEEEFPPEAVVDWGDLGKCVRWAFGIEGVVTLAVYGVWQLWHLWR
jgi:hypothetical protein